MKYKIEDIAGIIAAKNKKLYPSTIEFLLTDSRNLSVAGSSLFFAIITKYNDGHKYVTDLYDKGVRNFVVQILMPEFEKMNDANFLFVQDSVMALQRLAIHHRKNFEIPVIGITGSNGKTIIKEWLYQLLNEDFNVLRSPRSYNSQIGVPLSVWRLNEQTQLGIFEAGISMPYEMIRLEPIIRPTIGIFSNLGDAHQENFYSLQEKCLEKLKLFTNCDTLIYDGDNHFIEECIELSCLSHKTFAWSKKNSEAPLFISKTEKQEENTIIHFSFLGMEQKVRIPFTDDASIENAIHCLAAALYLKPGSTHLFEKFLKLESVDMRLDVKKGINNSILINDTYNSDINSLEIALDFMIGRALGSNLKPVLILSDILQSGALPKVLYKKVSSLIKIKGIKKIIGIGRDLKENEDKFDIEKSFYLTTEDFLREVNLNSFQNEIILIKGSRRFEFEKITTLLEEKVHETILETDLDAIIYNFNYFRSKLKPETKLIAMVKAFGYGIGAYELAKTLQNQRCDYLAVAVADEGAELRANGIQMPVIIMNPEMHTFNTLFQYNLEPEIYNFRLLDAIIKDSERRGITDFPVHIKLDTGMHRLGFQPHDIEEIARRVKIQKGVQVRSVFSHLAGSDSPDLDYYTQQQVDCFQKTASKFENLLGYPLLKHILNSAGIERFPEYQFDMVRLGIGLYGISSVPGNHLQTVATLKSTILEIQELKAGETVGYSRKGILIRDSRIACIPVGYADGLDRRLSNGKGKVYVNGTLCPIIGNICMDICMIDVTDANAGEGDKVIIFGKEIAVEEIAKTLETIPYEIFTSISPRVKRIYFKS